MSKTITSFNGGLFSSYLRGRYELEKYGSALQDVSNYHLKPYGALQNRAGTKFIDKHSTSDMILIPFQYNINQSYVIAIFNGKIQFILDDETIGSGGVAGGFSSGFSSGFNIDVSEYSKISPWTNEQLNGIQYVQIADTMYLVHPEVITQKLVRIADDDWTITAVDYKTGPFLPYNITSVGITPSAVTGTGITLTASSSLFVAGDVGRTIEMKQIRTDSTTTATSASYSPWIKVKGNWDFSTRGTWTGTIKIYRRVNGGTQAEFRSFNASADNNFVTDGDEGIDGVEMRIFGAGSCTATLTVDDFFVYGVAEITAFTSVTNVTADVLIDFDATTQSDDWAYNAFSETTGYPTAICLWDERMCIGGTLNQPNTVFLSKVDQWENYESSNSVLDAMSYKLNTSESIRWMAEQGDLVVGTSGNEYKLSAKNKEEPIDGDNVRAVREGAEGSNNVQALTVSDVLIFITRDGKRAKTIGYNFEADKLKARDLNALSGNELMASGVKQFVYKQNPFSELYFVLNDGTVALMTYDQEQNIYGWTKFNTSGLYKSACVLKGVSGDSVYFAVERVINGITNMFIEKMADREFVNRDDWNFVDCGLTTVNSVPSNIVTGLAHLENEEVAVIADGGVHKNQTVIGGQITLNRAYTKIHVGLPYTSYAQIMDIDAGDGRDSNQPKRKKMNKMHVKVRNTVGLMAGAELDKLEQTRIHSSSSTWLGAIQPVTDMIEINIDSSHKEEYAPYLVQELPQAQEILGFASSVSIGG